MKHHNNPIQPGELERIATGFNNTEGPVWHAEGYLLFSDIDGNTIYKWTPDGKIETVRSPSGYSNGLTFDQQGRLIACEHGNRRVSRTELDGSVVVLAKDYGGKRLNSPNDVVVKSDGSVYFTDPPYGLREPWGKPGRQDLPFQGVYRVLPGGKTPALVIDDLYRPNGLAFSPDEKVLYVANSESDPAVHAFDVQVDGTLANGRVFLSDVGWPDGVKVDGDGNLYVATNTNRVGIYDREGKHLEDIVTPEITRNCAFGGPDNKTLFITAMTSVYRVPLVVQGGIS
jgi:gluconolactonase